MYLRNLISLTLSMTDGYWSIILNTYITYWLRPHIRILYNKQMCNKWGQWPQTANNAYISWSELEMYIAINKLKMINILIYKNVLNRGRSMHACNILTQSVEHETIHLSVMDLCPTLGAKCKRMLKRNTTLAQNWEIVGYVFRDKLINQNPLLERRTEPKSSNQQEGKHMFYIGLDSIRRHNPVGGSPLIVRLPTAPCRAGSWFAVRCHSRVGRVGLLVAPSFGSLQDFNPIQTLQECGDLEK